MPEMGGVRVLHKLVNWLITSPKCISLQVKHSASDISAIGSTYQCPAQNLSGTCAETATANIAPLCTRFHPIQHIKDILDCFRLDLLSLLLVLLVLLLVLLLCVYVCFNFLSDN